jgi:hypothetical protein
VVFGVVRMKSKYYTADTGTTLSLTLPLLFAQPFRTPWEFFPDVKTIRSSHSIAKVFIYLLFSSDECGNSGRDDSPM